jgi:hypothetical protein
MQPKCRAYSKSFNAQVLAECAQPGASIASIALSHSLSGKPRPQMDSPANAEQHGAATCIYSITHAVGRSRLACSVIEYLR